MQAVQYIIYLVGRDIMAAGDVTAEIVASKSSAISAAVDAMRNGANDKWLICAVGNGLQALIVNIEEA
jgi:predicted HD phosphohydrolase